LFQISQKYGDERRNIKVCLLLKKNKLEGSFTVSNTNVSGFFFFFSAVKSATEVCDDDAFNKSLLAEAAAHIKQFFDFSAYPKTFKKRKWKRLGNVMLQRVM
jgi:hypothetical protein